MELLELFKRSESFCTLCLRQPGAARLKRFTVDQMYTYTSFLEVPAMSQYLCGWCEASLRSAALLRQRARRAQAWLKSYYTSDDHPEEHQKVLLSQLRQLHDHNLKTVLLSPTTLDEPSIFCVNNNGSTLRPYCQTQGGEGDGLVTVKADSKDESGGNANEMRLERTGVEFKMGNFQCASAVTTAEGREAPDPLAEIANQLTDNTTDGATELQILLRSDVEKLPKPMRPIITPRGKITTPVLVISGLPTPHNMHRPERNLVTHRRIVQKRPWQPPPEKADPNYPDGWDSERSTLAPNLDQELANRVRALDEITAENIRMLAYDFAEVKKVKHNFDKKLGLAGNSWLVAFLKRHSIDISSEGKVGSTATEETEASASEDIEPELCYVEETWLEDENSEQ